MLKIARGNPGKRPLNKAEPKPKVEAPKVPVWLPVAAKVEWKRITPELLRLNLLARIDLAALVAYCLAFADLETATRTLEAEGRVCRMPIIASETILRTEIDPGTGEKVEKVVQVKGEVIGERLKSHPCVAQANAAAQRMKAFLTEFGLTPASRSRVQAGDAAPTAGRGSKFFGA